jgi:hypothetical protein
MCSTAPGDDDEPDGVESFQRSEMRRALASLLLVVLSLPLFAPVLIANAASELPACWPA